MCVCLLVCCARAVCVFVRIESAFVGARARVPWFSARVLSVWSSCCVSRSLLSSAAPPTWCCCRCWNASREVALSRYTERICPVIRFRSRRSELRGGAVTWPGRGPASSLRHTAEPPTSLTWRHAPMAKNTSTILFEILCCPVILQRQSINSFEIF